jgi:DNA-binding FrmR family transcriptional regulator
MAAPDVPAQSLEATESEAVTAVDLSGVHIAPGKLVSVLDQLRQAQGQLGAVNGMIETGGDCTDIVTQMAAVAEALDRVGFAVIAAGLKQCITESPTSEGVDTSPLEKLFLSLA